MGTFVGDLKELRGIIAGLQGEGRTVVFTNGVFDLLHVGHIRALTDARSRGDCLVVGVNSDRSVAELKSPELPLNPEDERVEVLCALECVDLVTVFSDRTADAILLQLKPDVHAKGTDYTEETVPERETVLSYGGRIAIVGDPKNHASSSLMQKLLRLVRRKNGA